MTWQPPESLYAKTGNINDMNKFSVDQLRAVRQQTIEECARICDEHLEYPSLTPKHCADAIRKLGEVT